MHGDAVGRGERHVVGHVDARGVELVGEVLHRRTRDLGEVDVRQDQRGVPGPLGGELDQPLHHAEQTVRAGLDLVEQSWPALVVGVTYGVDEPLDGGDRRPEVVVEGGVEGVLCVLEGLGVGAVAGHLRVAGQVAVVVVDGRDDDVAPELGPVLAHPPAGVLDAPGLAGCGEQLERESGAAVLVGVEHREAATDGLVGGIALDPFGPEVPGLDDALGVEGDDRVVGDLADQQPQPLLAGLECRLEGVLLGEVAGDLRVAGELALLVVERGDDDVAPEPGAVLAHPPAGVLDAALVAGLRQQPEREAGAPVVVGVEHREAAADGLVGGVALDLLGAEVPGLDDALGVEGDDRVVGHLADQEPQPLLAGLAVPSGARAAR